MKFIQVETKQQIEMVEKIAQIIWTEHYSNIITDEQIKYMLHKFQSFEAILQGIKSEGYMYYLFYDHDTPFGYMAIQPKEGKLFLSKLYILKEYRGNGYSKQAFEFMEKYCHDNSLTAIWLTCAKNNERSLRVYEKCGFNPVKAVKMDIGGGFVMDDFIMEKKV